MCTVEVELIGPDYAFAVFFCFLFLPRQDRNRIEHVGSVVGFESYEYTMLTFARV